MDYQEHAEKWIVEFMAHFGISGDSEKGSLIKIAQNWFRGIYDLHDFVLEASAVISCKSEVIAQYWADRYDEDLTFDQVMTWLD